MPTPNYKTCIHCSKQVYKLAARGLCAPCYYREKRNGHPGYVKVRKPCSVDGCEHLSIAQGYCDKHYRRLKKHGVVEHERFDRWGHSSTHPLEQTHYYIKRTYGLPAEWKDFWQFVRDVGDKPTPKHRLKRIDTSKPYGKDNVEWVAPISDVSRKTREEKAEYQRAYRAARPEVFESLHLKKRFGITRDDYLKMLSEQNGVCAICKQPETVIHPQTGLPKNLAVDHCHGHGHIRALLCAKCNTGLGSFRDDIEILGAAIAYLKQHKPE